MQISNEDKDFILATIDSLCVALTAEDYIFTAGEKALVETSYELLTGSKDLPRGNYFEREPEEGEEWKG